MRGQPKRLSRNYRRQNGENVILYGLIWFNFVLWQRYFSALSAVFLFGRAFVCFCARLAVHYLAVSVLGSLIKQSLKAKATSTSAV